MAEFKAGTAYFDKGQNGLWVQTRDADVGDYDHTEEMGNGIHFDYDAQGNLLGVEILDVTTLPMPL